MCSYLQSNWVYYSKQIQTYRLDSFDTKFGKVKRQRAFGWDVVATQPWRFHFRTINRTSPIDFEAVHE